MSVSVMSAVWRDSKAKGSELLLLLAIADFADDAGEAYPSLSTLSQKTRLSERNVRYLIRVLENSGDLRTEIGAGPRGCNLYAILPGAKFAGAIQRMEGGNPASRGGNPASKGGQTTAPKPLRTINDPPKEPSVRARKPALIPLTEAERAKLLADFPHPDASEQIDMALAHESHLKYPTGQYLYVRNWLKRQNWTERKQTNGRNPDPKPTGIADKFAAYR